MIRSTKKWHVARKARKVLGCIHRKKLVLVRSRLVVEQVRRASKRKDVRAGTPPLEAMSIVLFCASRGHGSCIELWNVPVVFFHAATEAELFVCLLKSMRNDETVWKLF